MTDLSHLDSYYLSGSATPMGRAEQEEYHAWREDYARRTSESKTEDTPEAVLIGELLEQIQTLLDCDCVYEPVSSRSCGKCGRRGVIDQEAWMDIVKRANEVDALKRRIEVLEVMDMTATSKQWEMAFKSEKEKTAKLERELQQVPELLGHILYLLDAALTKDSQRRWYQLPNRLWVGRVTSARDLLRKLTKDQ